MSYKICWNKRSLPYTLTGKHELANAPATSIAVSWSNPSKNDGGYSPDNIPLPSVLFTPDK